MNCDKLLNEIFRNFKFFWRKSRLTIENNSFDIFFMSLDGRLAWLKRRNSPAVGSTAHSSGKNLCRKEGA